MLAQEFDADTRPRRHFGLFGWRVDAYLWVSGRINDVSLWQKFVYVRLSPITIEARHIIARVLWWYFGKPVTSGCQVLGFNSSDKWSFFHKVDKCRTIIGGMEKGYENKQTFDQYYLQRHL